MKELRVNVFSKTYWINDKTEQHCEKFGRIPIKIDFYSDYPTAINVAFDDGSIERYVKDERVK